MSAFSTGKLYRMGRRLSVLQYVTILIIAVVSFVFYFIYDYLFTSVLPWLSGQSLALIFVGADILLVWLTSFLMQKVRIGVFYRVTSDYLEYSVFGRVTQYQWSQFSGARFGRVSPGVICLVTFSFQGREFRLNQYVERPWALARDILDHITPYAKIEPGLLEKVECLQQTG